MSTPRFHKDKRTEQINVLTKDLILNSKFYETVVNSMEERSRQYRAELEASKLYTPEKIDALVEQKADEAFKLFLSKIPECIVSAFKEASEKKEEASVFKKR